MKDKEISLFISGDFLPINRIEQKILKNKANDIFGELAPIIKKADLAITNLECPLIENGKSISKTGPALKGNLNSAHLLANAGFNMVTLANNHIMDFGIDGLKSTLEVLDDNEINYVGAGINGINARKNFYFNNNGIIIAIINIAENEWSTTHDEKSGANPINPINNYYQIKQAKEKADKVIVITHGGHELYDLPSPKMKELFRFFVDVGADIVINHHPHFMSGYEIYNSAPIFYSLGNFIYDNQNFRNSNWNIGLALKLKVSKDKLDFEILSFEQSNDFAGIVLHDKNNNQKIKEKILELNKIIKSESELQYLFENHVRSKSNLYTSYIEPISNRYILALQNRKLFPRFLKKRKKLVLKNLISCESHREVLLNILNNEISNSQ